MSFMRILVLLIFAASLQAMSRPLKEAPSKVGVHTFEFHDGKREGRPVVVETWYPTKQKGPVDQPEDIVWIHPEEVRDAKLALGHHPLILMSHGHGGNRRDRTWLVEHLVSHGYIVASIEHFGNSSKTFNPLLTLRFWDRPKDVSFALSSLLKDPFFLGKIDPQKIGFIGYSLGGMTGLALAGAKACDVESVLKHLRSSFEEVDDPRIEGLCFDEAYGNYFEKRIKAMVLLAPAAYLYPSQSLEEVTVPIALVASEGDEILPFKDHAERAMRSLKNIKTKLLSKTSSHYVFLNRVSKIGHQIMREEIRAEPIELERPQVHREICEFVTNFFSDQF